VDLASRDFRTGKNFVHEPGATKNGQWQGGSVLNTLFDTFVSREHSNYLATIFTGIK
jgi:hypothetical protein